MPPKKSLFRQPGAKHFQLVHRSQRDPLIHDPEASKHVLKEFERENVKKGKSRTELESLLPSSLLEHDKSHNVGEASLYGIYYDDTDYDYMQHLRPVGVQEDGVDSVLIEAPSTSTSSSSNPKSKGKSKSTTGITLKEDSAPLTLPPESLPSQTELPPSTIYDSHLPVPTSLAGLQPDMDPHLRQVLEALEDEAFVDDGLEDDFFGELVKEGERDEDDEEQPEFEFDEWGVDDEQDEQEDREEEEEEKRKLPPLEAGGTTTSEEESDEAGWEERFKAFKKSQASRRAHFSDDEDDFESEGGDTIGTLPTISMSVVGGKKRKGRRAGGGSDASGYSMSSSSMYRNEALQTLDERFDQMMMKEYEEFDDEEEEHDEDEDSEEPPALLTSRTDFESMMNEFMNEHELLGRKIRPKLAGETGAEKLDTLRRAMGLDDRVRVAEGDYEGGEGDEDAWMHEEEDKKDRWDCETILSTYSNLENHPRIIRARDSKKVVKINLDPKTGFPVVQQPETVDDSGSDTDTPSRVTITRPKDETAEEKRARKAAVKANKQARRVEKKTTKEQFGAEIKQQMKTVRNRETRLKKL